ncbi:MAG TPA: DUF2905 domain-containing protein [Thermodesulfobacteriota bacterium]|nr:DUF2905 domain-containing protein [Thermodesulfobacteriota bacterium]
MESFQPIGKLLIIIGIAIVVIGVILAFGQKIPYIGRLPGDLYYKKDNFTIYFPIATSILISVILSLILYFFFRK